LCCYSIEPNIMKMHGDFAGLAVAILISTFGAVVTAGGTFLLTMLIGARYFHDELSYGMPLMVGPLVAIICGVAAFFLIFGKIRSL
jgi:hypothetical protein